MKLFYNFFIFFMSTNAPTSRWIMYMHCHVDEVSLEVFFFSKKYFNMKFPFFFQKKYFFPTFFQTPLCFPSCFTLWIIFQFVIPVYIFFLYKWDNSWETWLELFKRALLIFNRSLTQIEKPDLNSFRKFLQFFGWFPSQF